MRYFCKDPECGKEVFPEKAEGGAFIPLYCQECLDMIALKAKNLGALPRAERTLRAMTDRILAEIERKGLRESGDQES